MDKKLSIIIPVYNVKNYLPKCVDSLIAQKSNEIEIILVDDGSTDGSSELCDSYAQKTNIISTYHRENGGASDARNYGITKAKGEYIWFIDSDDFIEPDCIEKFITIMNEYKSDVIICQSKVVNLQGQIYDECKYTITAGEYSSDSFMSALKNNPKSVIFCPQCYMVRKQFILDENILFYKGIIHEDELWIPQLLIRAERIYYSGLNIYYHLMRETSVQHSSGLKRRGRSAYVVSSEILKILDSLPNRDFRFLRDHNINIFLQAVWKNPEYLKANNTISRFDVLRNSYYLKTRLKCLLYFLSPKAYLLVHSVANIKNNKINSDCTNVGIVTITDKDNYGNRLQNYALQKYCEKNERTKTYTLENYSYSNSKRFYFLRCIRQRVLKREQSFNRNRLNHFLVFDENIEYYPKKINAFTRLDIFDKVIVGSDQVWNPNYRRLRDVDLLKNVDGRNRIAYAASFGVEKISQKYKESAKKELEKFSYISVREDAGKRIVEDIANRGDVEVLVDPTMLLTADEWDRVAKRPTQMDKLKSSKYILNYFLGALSEERKKEIKRIADKYGCEVVNILDKNDPFYETGPSEFIWLEKNAFLICTDSFHSSVFAILYSRPFVVFSRDDNTVSMNSRIETLLSKFQLPSREYNGDKITDANIQCDFTAAHKILEVERKKSMLFLKKALIGEGRYEN